MYNKYASDVMILGKKYPEHPALPDKSRDPDGRFCVIEDDGFNKRIDYGVDL